MAQQVEQFTRNEQVASSNLASSSSSGAKETLLRFFVKKLHCNPCSFAITKSHARFNCSVVNAFTTFHCRYQLFARVLAMLVELYFTWIFIAKETLLRFFVKKLHCNPCSFAITKSHARFNCSVVNAFTTFHCRYQLFARVLAMLVELYFTWIFIAKETLLRFLLKKLCSKIFNRTKIQLLY